MVATGPWMVGNINDHVPLGNIPPFGMCLSLQNPMVAAQTALAGGILTPMPCTPQTLTPWTPGSPTVLIDKAPALNDTSKLNCSWGGVITIALPGQKDMVIP